MRLHDSPLVEIELLLTDGEASRLAESTDAPPVDPWKAVMAVAIILLAGLLVIRATSSPLERPERAAQPADQNPAGPEPSTAPATPVGVRFEEPSYLARVPGPQAPLVADVSGVSLLYVSILDHPTLVDLDSGNRSELHVADETDRYLFMIEQGQVVTGDPTIERSRVPAGGRAFTVLAYRSAAQWSDIVDPYGQRALNIEPMCGPPGCALPAMGPPASQGGDIIRLLDPVADAAIASLFDPTIWTQDGNWMVPPASSGLDVRLPIPAAHSSIYLIHQP
jgi:hypothetical protein